MSIFWNVFGVVFILLISKNFKVNAKIKESQTKVFWLEIDEWSSCSTTCGPGTRHKRVICIKKSFYTEEMVSDERCKNIPSISPTMKECNLGNCYDNYIWKPGKWSECSQSCGSNGRKTRDVECVYDEGSGNLVSSDSKYCEQSLRPEASSSCNLIDCPLTLVPGEWGKCKKNHKCSAGTQRRPMTCISILKNGKPKSLPRHACSGTIKPPVSWRKCYDHMNTKECLKDLRIPPIIEVKKNTLVQMRKTKLLNLEVGQLAYVYLYTRIMINCAVTYYVPRDIIWKYGNTIYNYHGKSKDSIRVDKKGRLRIRKFESKDQGTWTCIAGPNNASVIIKVRNPAVGFQDWKLRTTLWNKEMLNEDPEVGMTRSEVIQWIKKGWSQCSVTCGGEGFQSRDVHCEQSDKQHYNILDDSICEKKGQKKPLTRRICQMATQCPKWRMTGINPANCTNKCLRIGFGKIEGSLHCIHQGQVIESNACDKKEKPDMECPNERCQVDWKTSNWSKCSKSCGGVGIMARYLICIWKNTEDPAGSFCYNQKTSLPEVIKSCRAPKCNLKCVDLYATCKPHLKKCVQSIYRYSCCKSCSRLAELSKMQGDAIDKTDISTEMPEKSKNSKLNTENSFKVSEKSFKGKPKKKDFFKKIMKTKNQEKEKKSIINNFSDSQKFEKIRNSIINANNLTATEE